MHGNSPHSYMLSPHEPTQLLVHAPSCVHVPLKLHVPRCHLRHMGVITLMQTFLFPDP